MAHVDLEKAPYYLNSVDWASKLQTNQYEHIFVEKVEQKKQTNKKNNGQHSMAILIPKLLTSVSSDYGFT